MFLFSVLLTACLSVTRSSSSMDSLCLEFLWQEVVISLEEKGTGFILNYNLLLPVYYQFSNFVRGNTILAIKMT